MKVVIYTQIVENYGTPSEPYWKFKGGDEYIIKDVDLTWDLDELVELARPMIEASTEMYSEYIVEWDLVEDSYQTEYELSQLKYEGKITFPAKEIAHVR